MKIFTNETMLEITLWLEDELQKDTKTTSFIVLNPDYILDAYAGKSVKLENTEYIYRGYKSWIDLAQLMFCKMLTPKLVDENLVQISFTKLDLDRSFHKSDKNEEKYGVASEFFEIHKNEEPAFLLAYKKALLNVKIQNRKRVLNLGVNAGDEFQLIKDILHVETFKDISLKGVDYCPSAIKFAQNRFKEDKNTEFFAHDINKLDELNLEKSDLIISIGTFQSPNINFKKLLMSLVQNYLTKDGAIILGFPNCRWMGGEMIYGAKIPNYEMSEMSNLYKDVVYAKKYLQQKKFRVTITGKDYIFLTATRIGSLVSAKE